MYQGNLCWIPGDSNGSSVLAFNNGGGLHWPFVVNDGTNDCTSAALLKNFTGNNLYVGGLFAGTYKVKYANGTAAYGTTARDLRTRLYLLPYRANIKKVTAYFSQMASGSSAQLSLFKNYVTSSIGTANVDFLNKTLSYTANGALTEFEINKEINKVSAFYMNVRVTGQISIPRIEVEFEPSKT
jgi:hypothetical protein